MRPTTAALPLGLAIAGAGIAYLLEVALVAGGMLTFTPPYTLPLSLFAIAGLALVFGWPIRQSLRGRSTARLDPFRAMRVVLLAKASVLVGSLLGGAALGITVHVLARPVIASGDDLVRSLLSVVAAGAMIVAGLVVEHWCRLPPDDEEPSAAGVRGE